MYKIAQHGTPLVPSDSDNCVSHLMIYVGGGGDINCILQHDSANTLFKAVPTGTLLPAKILKIWQTGTTANNIVGLS